MVRKTEMSLVACIIRACPSDVLEDGLDVSLGADGMCGHCG